MVSSREKGVEMQDYMINWNVGPLGLVLRPDLGADMPPVVSQVLPGESVASLAGVSVGDMLVSINGKKASKLGYEKAMKLLYKQKLPMILHFRIPQFKTLSPNHAAAFYQQQQTPTGASMSMTPHSNGHANGHGPYHSSSFIAPSPPPPPPPQQSYPGQFVQYNQQHHQQYQHQHQQQHQHSMSRSMSQRQASGSMIGGSSTRGMRSLSVLSTSTATKEQKLKKQFSVVWESGSLGFSFRPYAPGVNIPTVDLIGARGDGKNMEQVCVNDVLIAINGENTKSLGVERVLKMLHVLEKPVVLRFHKSSHRIENPPASQRQRRRSSAKLPAVVEKEMELEEDGDAEEDEPEMVGVMEEEGMPSVRFADQIQLRSELRDDVPPPPPHAPMPPSTPEPTPKRYSSRVNVRLDEADTNPLSASSLLPASKFAVRAAASSAALPPRTQSNHRELQNNLASSARVPESLRAAPPQAVSTHIPLNQPVHFPLEQDLDDFPEPDQAPEDAEDVDESKLPHVPITVVGSVPPKRASSSFVIPLEHAREIVAKSSGKPVDKCEFGGVPLPQIREGSVQARLLVTFAKACLAKQMKQLREGGSDRAVTTTEQRSQTSPRQFQDPPPPPRSSSPHSSENRSSLANAGSTYVPSNASTFAGNSLGPGKPKFLAYTYQQTQQNVGTDSAAHPSTTLAQERLNSHVVAENGTSESQRGANAMRGTDLSNASSNGLSSDSAERARSSEDAIRRYLERATEPFGTRSTPPNASALPRYSEPERASSGGLTMSQLRVSDKLSSVESKLSSVESDPDLRGMLKDLNSFTPPDNNNDALPKRMTAMISLDALLVEEETKEEPLATTEAPAASPPADSDNALRQLEAKLELAGVAVKTEGAVAKQLTGLESVELPQETQPIESQLPQETQPIESAQDRRRVLSMPASADHPVIQELCVDSRDLELVMIGRDVDMILSKKEVVEEIQDILDSLEMELQFERHSTVGIGRGSIVDEPPVRCCSRCGKSGDMADLALDSERRELYCQNCWDVFFYRKSSMGSPRSSRSRLVPPEIDTPTDFDPFEYSLHDSMVNVADDFHPWRHLNFDDSSSERDSNMTQASSITSHADEVWL